MHARLTRIGRVARRTLVTAAATGAAGLLGGCDAFFGTNVTNPNAVVEDQLANPAAATALANGAGASLTRALTAAYGPYATVSDELSWIGSREFWSALGPGRHRRSAQRVHRRGVSAGERGPLPGRVAIAQLEALDKTSALRNRVDLARAYLYAGVTYALIAHMYDDFVLGTDPPLGDRAGR
jgi:hypothetical protein